MKISQNFVAFSEYMNFNITKYICNALNPYILWIDIWLKWIKNWKEFSSTKIFSPLLNFLIDIVLIQILSIFVSKKHWNLKKIFFILILDLIFVEEMSIKQLWSCLMFKAIQSYVICNALNPPYILWIDDCTGLNEEFHHIIVSFSGG